MPINTLRYIVLPLSILAVLLVVFDYGGLDLYCGDLFYYPRGGGWIYKHS